MELRSTLEWLAAYQRAHTGIEWLRAAYFEPRMCSRDEFLYELAGVVAREKAPLGHKWDALED